MSQLRVERPKLRKGRHVGERKVPRDVSMRRKKDGKRIESEVTKIMGGSIVETESERLIRIGKESRQEEIDQAIAERDKAIEDTIIGLAKSGDLTMEVAAGKLGMSVEAFQEKLKG